MKIFNIYKQEQELHHKLKVGNIYNYNGEALDEILQNKKLFVTVASGIQNPVQIATVNDVNLYCGQIGNESQVIVESKVYFDTFQQMVDYGAQYLSNGHIAVTKGFYEIGDGGGAVYEIRSQVNSNRIAGYCQEKGVQSGYALYYSSPIIDGISLINIGTESNPLYADLQIVKGSYVNLRQVGGRPLEDGVKIDNSTAMNAALSFMKRKKFFTRIYIPEGHWCFSEVLIENKQFNGMGVKVTGNYMNTVIMPYSDSQEYIFRIGTYNSSSPANYASRGSEISNMTFQCGTSELEQDVLDLYGNTKYVSIAALYIQSSFYSSFLNLRFQYIYNTAMVAASEFESHFSYLYFNCCGGVRNNVVYPVTVFDRKGMSYASAVSANWIRLMHFHSCIGPYICGGNSNFTHNEFNAVIVTGSASEYNEHCPDLQPSGYQQPEYSVETISTESSPSLNRWGVIDQYQGHTGYWPNLYNVVQCCTFDNWAIRYGDDSSTVKYYRMNSILHHESNIQFHVYLGLCSMPIGTNLQGPFVAHIQERAAVVSIDQIFEYDAYPIYSGTYKYMYQGNEQTSYGVDMPKYNVPQVDGRIIRSLDCRQSSVRLLDRGFDQDTPYHLTNYNGSTGSQQQFIAKAGKTYGIKFYNSSSSATTWLQSPYNASTSYSTGLSVYKDGVWKKVGALKITSLQGSDGYWRYAVIPQFFFFQEDTLVRIGGSNIEFFYEAYTGYTGSISTTLIQNWASSTSSHRLVYSIEKSSDIQQLSVYSTNSSISASIIDSNVIVTAGNNTLSYPRDTLIIITGKDENGRVIAKSSFVPVSQPKA